MKYFVIGGAGFIGSNLVELLSKQKATKKITVYDNFSSGQMDFLNSYQIDIVKGDIKNLDYLTQQMQGNDIVYHFASNPDIAKAAIEPSIDFWNGTALMNNVLEAMRVNGIKKMLYASGSGVYGNTGELCVSEDYSPKLPVSMYGASKLACEALACAYCSMFDMDITAFRFANVVGKHQTHGVIYDFIKKLLKNSKELKIFGDGKQSKSYIYIFDVLNAMRCVELNMPQGFNYFNVGTNSHITVTEIANIIVEQMGLQSVIYKYTGGNVGWRGDVSILRLNSNKLRSLLGWGSCYTTEEAIKLAVKENYDYLKSSS